MSTAGLVDGLLQLGRGMGLQVIAEGIEDLEQADWLLRHGCAMAQGFAFGRPAPLPSPAEVLMSEVTQAPVEEVAGPLLPEPPAPPVDLPRPRIPTTPEAHDLHDTGSFAARSLFDELADPDE